MTSLTKLLNTLWFQLLECPPQKIRHLSKMPCFPSSCLTIDLQNVRNQFSECGGRKKIPGEWRGFLIFFFFFL